MGCLEKKYPDKTFEAKEAAHKTFELLFEAQRANLL